jgi:hypothetical protein
MKKETIIDTGGSRSFIREAIPALWNIQHDWVTRDQLATELGKQDWVKDALKSAGVFESRRRTRLIGNQIDWFSAHYTRGWYGLKAEFNRKVIAKKKAYSPKNAN